MKFKIHLLNYSGIWYTAWHPHITEKKYWSYGPRLCTPLQKNSAGALELIAPIAPTKLLGDLPGCS